MCKCEVPCASTSSKLRAKFGVCSAAALLACGRVKLAAGDALEAKLDLQRALGLAHRNLANQQLVVQARS